MADRPLYVSTPRSPIYRIGRQPRPLEWPPWNLVGDGRFDDPRDTKTYRVLYAGDRRACFLERLADFRPDLDGVVAQPLTQNWIDGRRIARFSLRDREIKGRWLDLRAAATIQFLRQELKSVLRQHGLNDFDLSTVTSENLDITQRIGLWAYEDGCLGIVYTTRFTPALSCWAIFERPQGARYTDIDIEPLNPLDEDFAAVREIHGLPLPSTAPGC